jgi:hypothetical protein
MVDDRISARSCRSGTDLGRQHRVEFTRSPNRPTTPAPCALPSPSCRPRTTAFSPTLRKYADWIDQRRRRIVERQQSANRRLCQAVATISVLVRRFWAFLEVDEFPRQQSSSRASWRNPRRWRIWRVQMRDQRRWRVGTGSHGQRRHRAYVAILRNIAKGSAPEP